MVFALTHDHSISLTNKFMNIVLNVLRTQIINNRNNRSRGEGQRTEVTLEYLMLSRQQWKWKLCVLSYSLPQFASKQPINCSEIIGWHLWPNTSCCREDRREKKNIYDLVSSIKRDNVKQECKNDSNNKGKLWKWNVRRWKTGVVDMSCHIPRQLVIMWWYWSWCGTKWMHEFIEMFLFVVICVFHRESFAFA